MTKYVPGSGVGATSIFARRAKMYRAAQNVRPRVQQVSEVTVDDAIVASLSTSLTAYNNAAPDEWITITQSEYNLLTNNVTGTTKVGISDTYFNAATYSGLTQDKAAIVANSASVNTPAIPANSYLYAFAVKWSGAQPGINLQVYSNSNSSSNTGFNPVGSVLPNTSSGGGFIINYYVRKSVSNTNGTNPGLLSIFTSTKMDYPSPWVGSGGYLGFYQNFSVNNGMLYNVYVPANSADVPTSSTVLNGNITGYGAFAIQGLATQTKQWN